MPNLLKYCVSLCLFYGLLPPAIFGQTPQISTLQGTSPHDNPVPIPIFAIGRKTNVVTVSTVDPGNPDQYAQQSNQVGVTVTISGVSADPSNTVNGSFPICGPPTPGCIAPITTSFSFQSQGADFSTASSTELGYSAVARTGCPLLPAAYFSFCGDSRPGGGVGYPTDGSLVEILSTQDDVGTTVWASSLADGNSADTRVTGCEQMFIESGNEWRIQCDYYRRNGGSIDIDMKNDFMTFGVGDGLTSSGTGAELVLSGSRNLASFGILGNHTLFIDTGATPSGSVMPSTGILRMRNGSTVCWENATATASLCQTTDANDRFSFSSGVVSPTYATTTNCVSLRGQCGSAAAGAVSIPAGSTSIIVFTTAVTAQSQIFVQEDSSLSDQLSIACNTAIGRVYQVTQRLPGFSFQVNSNLAAIGNPSCLSYHIVN